MLVPSVFCATFTLPHVELVGLLGVLWDERHI